MKKVILLWVTLGWLVVGGVAGDGAEKSVLRVEGLRCELREEPVGIGELRPRLDWRVVDGSGVGRNLMVKGWQVWVSGAREGLEKGGDVWDSGRVEGDLRRVVFGGRKLGTGEKVWWKVRVWDGEGKVSEWSEAGSWSVGLLDVRGMSDWVGNWIGLEEVEVPANDLGEEARKRARTRRVKWMVGEIEGLRKRELPAFDKEAGLQIPPGSDDSEMSQGQELSGFFRKEFSVGKLEDVEQASVWFVPYERAEIWVNGKFVAGVAKWDVARRFFVKEFLKEGKNVVGLRVRNEDGYLPAAMGELEVVMKSGKSMRVETGKGWSFSTVELPSWSEVGFVVKDWKEAKMQGGTPWATWENATQRYCAAPYLRKEFELKAKAVKRAVVYATALGIYEMEINGKKVGNEFFAPGWTDYLRRVHVQAWEVEKFLKEGENAMGVILGDGWFAGVMGHVGKKWSFDAYTRARAMLVVEYADGEVQKIGTDRTWKGAFGAIRYADLFQGSGYDRRREFTGWSEVGFDDAKWKRVTEGLKPLGESGVPPMTRMVAEGATLDGVRVTEELPAISVKQVAEGRWVVDFGQNFVGWVRMVVRGKSGDRVVLRHAEILNPDGSLYTANLRGAAATDEFWLNGKGEEVLEPKFTFHGFRYAEVSGLREAPKVGDFVGVAVHTPMRRTGWFECSDERLNKLFENIVWGQRGNYLEVPTDCPQRDERLGWTGDVQFFARTAAFNYDVEAFLERWLVTHIEDSQYADGTFADVTPIVPARKGRVSTAWGDAAILVTHVLWKQYGDTRLIERYFYDLERYIDWLDRKSEADGTVKVGGYGDWLHKGGTAKTEVMDTAYFAHLCELMEEMARATGKTREAEKMAALKERVKGDFAKAFLKEDGAILESGQTGYALAFTMGMVPEKLRVRMSGRFEEAMRATGWHLATGFIGTPRLMPGLFDAGLDEVGYKVLLQDTYPSWLYQVKVGATTMWERWDGWTPEGGPQTVKMNSFNHYSFGAVGEALYRYVLGIETEGVGFGEVRIAPRIGGGLRFARGAYESAKGRIGVEWKADEKGSLTELEVEVPVGVRAVVEMKGRDVRCQRSDVRGERAEGMWVKLEEVPGLEIVERKDGKVVVRVGSGKWGFGVR